MPCDGGVTTRRAIASVAVVMALIGWGCNSRLLRPPLTIYVDGGGRQVSANVRERDYRFNSVLLSYFPSSAPVHPGDAVNFEVRDSGEPHTVAMGRLVDRAIAALGTLGGAEGIRTIEQLPQMRALPSVFPNTISDDAPRLNASAAERCFLERGAPAVSSSGGAEACPEQDQPDFDGRHELFSSGFLQEGEPFRIKIAGDVRPGTYGFMCLVHRSAMTGAIEVRASDVARPPVAEMRQQGQDEENEVISTLEPAARRSVTASRDVILAGTGPVGRARGAVTSFIPELARVSVGEPLTWQLYGMHTIAFEPSRDAQEGILLEDRDGIHVNLDAWRAVSGPAPPAAAVAFPPTEPALDISGGMWSGEGSFSSGVLRATAPATISYTLTFTEAGTYRYRCLVHPRMRGRVAVEGN